ncbi:origin recognition complex subunit 4 [Coemansia biformis]|uniref:Origin recognition complex subunit 4 n=1 Tax=Coemansia biformis TaxID=1286918 RepID=A0A9W7YD90_9FUNG|nr:origin recognition complex subunit 4 [Coemansia biformis]
MPARDPCSAAITDDGVRRVRQAVLGRLHGRAPLPELVGLEAPLAAVLAVLSQTVASAEGNSALLLGPRGSGKSAIVSRALAMLEDGHGGRGGEAGAARYHVVRLSGFVHTSDRIALRDIARQLLIKQDLESILIGSFADAFSYILGLLRSAGAEGAPMPPVVFVLEEFDLLAQHPKQSLLYTLFDIAQSQQTPIAVLGVTARIDVMDLLEKRVKSRFSHRQIHVHPTPSLAAFTQVARAALCIDVARDCGDCAVSAGFVRQFNAGVDEVLAAGPVARHIEGIFEFGKDVRQLLRMFVAAAAGISPAEPLLQLARVQASIARDAGSAKARILGSISLLELCLIVAMRSLVQGGSAKYNFEMVYNEYKTFMSRHMVAVAAGGAMKIYKKPVALKAFETLVELEIVRPVLASVAAEGTGGTGTHGRNDLLAGTAAGARVPKEYRMVQLMLEPGQVADLVAERVDVPAVVRRWAQ